MNDNPTEARRALVAAVIGNVLEWYDFAVYAYLATIIAKKFFPAGDDVVSQLSTFAAFGVGFLVRPLGGLVIGRLGDLRGRKAALVLTIMLMAAGTVLIGIIPTYERIGVVAPALLVLARVLQGFSAGGEWGTSTAFIVEWAPEAQRGWYGSFQQMSVAGGLLLGSSIAALGTTLFSAAAIDEWAWRIPFLLGGLIGPVGMYMRRNIGETPRFRAADDAPAAVNARSAWLAARACGFTVLWTVSYYLVLTYLPTFAQKQLRLLPSEALWSTVLALAALICAVPLFGRLSDRIGRKPLLLASGVGFIVLPYPLFGWMLSDASFITFAIAQTVLALTTALYSGAGPAAIAEMFPTAIRSTWMSIGYSLAVATFGGFAPFVATWLIKVTESPRSPSFYVMAAAAVSTLVVLGMKETAHEPLT